MGRTDAGIWQKVWAVGARMGQGARQAAKHGRGPPFTVFLDRDGVFNRHPRLQVRRFERLEWLPGAAEAHARLKEAGLRTCLVTNQPGTGVGLSTPRMMRRLHERFQQHLAAAGAPLDRIEMALAPPGLGHRRRKPRAGMLEDAADAFRQEEGFDARRAVMVGDKPRDAAAAHAFGIPAILLATTLDAATLERRCRKEGTPFLAIAEDLPTAVDLVLELAGSS